MSFSENIAQNIFLRKIPLENEKLTSLFRQLNAVQRKITKNTTFCIIFERTLNIFSAACE